MVDLRTIMKSRCVVGWSGGKDSAYLLYLAKEEYGGEPVAVTVDTGFMSRAAWKNIYRVPRLLGIDHVVIHRGRSTFNLIYQEHVPQIGQKPFGVCLACSALIHARLMQVAGDMGIEYVLVGLTPDENSILESVGEPTMRLYGTDEPPYVIYPYTEWTYDAERVRRRLAELGIMSLRQSSPFRTNCAINWLIINDAVRATGVNPYRAMFMSQAAIKPRLRRKFRVLDWLIRQSVRLGIFKPLARRRVLERLEER